MGGEGEQRTGQDRRRNWSLPPELPWAGEWEEVGAGWDDQTPAAEGVGTRKGRYGQGYPDWIGGLLERRKKGVKERK